MVQHSDKTRIRIIMYSALGWMHASVSQSADSGSLWLLLVHPFLLIGRGGFSPKVYWFPLITRGFLRYYRLIMSLLLEHIRRSVLYIRFLAYSLRTFCKAVHHGSTTNHWYIRHTISVLSLLGDYLYDNGISRVPICQAWHLHNRADTRHQTGKRCHGFGPKDYYAQGTSRLNSAIRSLPYSYQNFLPECSSCSMFSIFTKDAVAVYMKETRLPMMNVSKECLRE